MCHHWWVRVDADLAKLARHRICQDQVMFWVLRFFVMAASAALERVFCSVQVTARVAPNTWHRAKLKMNMWRGPGISKNSDTTDYLSSNYPLADFRRCERPIKMRIGRKAVEVLMPNKQNPASGPGFAHRDDYPLRRCQHGAARPRAKIDPRMTSSLALIRIFRHCAAISGENRIAATGGCNGQNQRRDRCEKSYEFTLTYAHYPSDAMTCRVFTNPYRG